MSNNEQVQSLIAELGKTELGYEAKQKTIDTLNAITGML